MAVYRGQLKCGRNVKHYLLNPPSYCCTVALEKSMGMGTQNFRHNTSFCPFGYITYWSSLSPLNSFSSSQGEKLTADTLTKGRFLHTTSRPSKSLTQHKERKEKYCASVVCSYIVQNC